MTTDYHMQFYTTRNLRLKIGFLCNNLSSSRTGIEHKASVSSGKTCFVQDILGDDNGLCWLSDLVSRTGMSSALSLSIHCFVVLALRAPSQEQVHHFAGCHTISEGKGSPNAWQPCLGQARDRWWQLGSRGTPRGTELAGRTMA